MWIDINEFVLFFFIGNYIIDSDFCCGFCCCWDCYNWYVGFMGW